MSEKSLSALISAVYAIPWYLKNGQAPDVTDAIAVDAYGQSIVTDKDLALDTMKLLLMLSAGTLMLLAQEIMLAAHEKRAIPADIMEVLAELRVALSVPVPQMETRVVSPADIVRSIQGKSASDAQPTTLSPVWGKGKATVN